MEPKTIMISWEQFSNTMTDILSSGGMELSDWHRKKLTELFDDVHKNDVGTFVNRFYADIDPSELMEDELAFIGSLIDASIVTKITFVAN